MRRAKALSFSACESRPATVAPAGSNQGSREGNEAAEASGVPDLGVNATDATSATEDMVVCEYGEVVIARIEYAIGFSLLWVPVN